MLGRKSSSLKHILVVFFLHSVCVCELPQRLKLLAQGVFAGVLFYQPFQILVPFLRPVGGQIRFASLFHPARGMMVVFGFAPIHVRFGLLLAMFDRPVGKLFEHDIYDFFDSHIVQIALRVKRFDSLFVHRFVLVNVDQLGQHLRFEAFPFRSAQRFQRGVIFQLRLMGKGGFGGFQSQFRKRAFSRFFPQPARLIRLGLRQRQAAFGDLQRIVDLSLLVQFERQFVELCCASL